MAKMRELTASSFCFVTGLMFGVVLLVVLFPHMAISGETIFVSAAKAALKKEPKMDSVAVGELVRGDELQVEKKEGLWFFVKRNSIEGWVPKLFLSPSKPIGAASLASDVKSEFKSSRERTTPRSVVASTRGLDSSKSMSRVRDGGLIYRVDYRSVTDLESIKITNGEVDAFQREVTGP